jgi:hypothetical protein
LKKKIDSVTTKEKKKGQQCFGAGHRQFLKKKTMVSVTTKKTKKWTAMCAHAPPPPPNK